MKVSQQRAIISALRDDLRVAIDLRDRSFARRLDQDLVARGGRIIYAIDASIMNAHFAAHELAEPGDRGRSVEDRANEYQVFRGPVDGFVRPMLGKRQARLAQVMHSFLVEGRAGPGDLAQQLLLLPGHVAEARNLYDTIVEQFAKQPKRLADIAEVAKQLGDVIAAGAKNAEGQSAEDLAAALSRALFEIDAPHLKFHRFNELLRRRRILGLPAAASEEPFNDARLRDDNNKHLFLSRKLEPERPGFLDETDGSSSWWELALTGRLPSIYVDSDRAALSTLDKLNRSLDPDRVRVVLFTNNNLLIEAGAGYRPYKDSRSDFYGRLSFSDLYLRHPKALLVDGAFVRPHAEADGPRVASSDVDGWIDALLAGSLDTPVQPGDRAYGEDISWGERWLQFRERARRMRRRLDDDTLFRRPLARNAALHTRFAYKWAMHLSRLTSDHVLNAAGAETALEQLVTKKTLNSAEQVEQVVAEAKARVRRLTEESWSDFFNTAADTGLELIGIPPIDSQTNVWPAPPLYARGNAAMSEPLHAFWWPIKVREDAPQILAQINGADREENLQLSYVHALCYALFFAFAGRWSLTKLLAQRAIQIARGLEVDGPKAGSDAIVVTGREAYYLLSVAHRVTARTREHYLEARAALQSAMDCPADPIDGEGPSQEPLSGLRFETEGIAIDVGAAIAAGGPEKAQSDDLRQRIRSSLARAPVCGVAPVRKLCTIALRSEFFLTLSFPGPRKKGKIKRDPAAQAELSEELRNLIRQQLADLAEIYGDHANMPLRDRALLRLAAVTVGDGYVLPASLHQSSLAALQQTDKANAIRSLDRRRLARIETIVDERLGQ
jgi:hypothetical protein